MAAQVHRAFGAWAGGEGLRVRFEPDATMAVDRLGRPGVPLPEVHVLTLGADVGGRQLLDLAHLGALARRSPR